MNSPQTLIDPFGLRWEQMCQTYSTSIGNPGESGYAASASQQHCFWEWFDDDYMQSLSPSPTPGTNSGGNNPNGGQPTNNCTPGTKGCYNVPTAQQQCLNEYNNSTSGKAIQFASPLQMIPGWGNDPSGSILETAAGVTSKATVITAAANAGKPVIQTLSSDGWNLAGPIEGFIGWAGSKTLNFAKVAGPVAWSWLSSTHSDACCVRWLQ